MSSSDEVRKAIAILLEVMTIKISVRVYDSNHIIACTVHFIYFSQPTNQNIKYFKFLQIENI